MSGGFSPFKKYFGGNARKKAEHDTADLEKLLSAAPLLEDTGSNDVHPRRHHAKLDTNDQDLNESDLDVDVGDHEMDEIDHEIVDEDEIQDEEAVAVAQEAPRAESNTRVKTTFLGFEGVDDLMDIDDEPLDHGHSTHRNELTFPAGWVAIVEGPGRGHSFSIGYGVNAVGRSHEQPICLDFGDTSISREGHVFIAFDEDEEAFFVGHGGKSNLVRLNGKPLLSTEPLSNGDQIKVGQTVLRFVALCDDDFSWTADE